MKPVLEILQAAFHMALEVRLDCFA
jgi:hypothetical protein